MNSKENNTAASTLKDAVVDMFDTVNEIKQINRPIYYIFSIPYILFIGIPILLCLLFKLSYSDIIKKG